MTANHVEHEIATFPRSPGRGGRRRRRLRAKPRKNGVKTNYDDRQEEGHVEVTTMRTHFTFRVDTWTPDGESIVEHVAGVEDYQVALATFLATCQRWPGTPVTLRQGARVIEDSRRLRMA
jgi:hypothetical protein